MQVVAPARLPRRASDWVKTDRKDHAGSADDYLRAGCQSQMQALGQLEAA